jgi:hypothetical protein
MKDEAAFGSTAFPTSTEKSTLIVLDYQELEGTVIFSPMTIALTI